MRIPQSDPTHLTWVSQQAEYTPLSGIGRKGHTQSSEDHNGKYLMYADRDGRIRPCRIESGRCGTKFYRVVDILSLKAMDAERAKLK